MADTAIATFCKYQRVRALSPDTIRRRAISLNQFSRFIDPLPLFQASGTLVEDWLHGYRSPATRRAYRSDLLAFYTWAAKRDLSANPVLKTDSIRVPKSLPRPVPPSHLPAVLASAPPDVRLMIALAAYAGLRCAEIAALDTADLDLVSETPTLAVREGKGAKDRIVPVHPHLAVMLRRLPPGRIVAVNAQTVGTKVSEHLRALGIEATAHKLRATFCTELVRVTSGNVVLAAYLAGHSDVSTTMKYVGWQGGPGAVAVDAMYPATAA